MIGFVVNSKVKRFIRANRESKTLITRDFLIALNAEIEGMTILSVERACDELLDLKRPISLAAPISEGKIIDRLVCDQRIKERIKEIKPDATISKAFLADINSYAGAIILESLKSVRGAYVKTLVIDDREIINNAQVEELSSPTTSKLENATLTEVKPIPDLKIGLPTKFVDVVFEIHVQKVILTCEQRIYTGKNDKQLERAITSTTKRRFESTGICGSITIKMISIKREKV